MIIYKCTNKLNGKSYIGQTIQKFSRRKQMHLLYATNEKYYGKFNCQFYQAIRKYGKDSFDWSIIAECDNIQELNDKEKYYIEFYDTMKNGYNLTTGGENFIRTQETKDKYSELFKGRIVSEETRKKLSEARKGKKFTEEHKKNLSLSQKGKESPLKGRKLSDETKKKMSDAQMGNKKGLGKIAWNKGLTMPENIKQKISITNKGVNSKPVERYDTDGNYIDSWGSITQFLKSENINISNGSHISSVCLGKRNSAYGFKWKYKKIE